MRQLKLPAFAHCAIPLPCTDTNIPDGEQPQPWPCLQARLQGPLPCRRPLEWQALPEHPARAEQSQALHLRGL